MEIDRTVAGSLGNVSCAFDGYKTSDIHGYTEYRVVLRNQPALNGLNLSWRNHPVARPIEERWNFPAALSSLFLCLRSRDA